MFLLQEIALKNADEATRKERETRLKADKERDAFKNTAAKFGAKAIWQRIFTSLELTSSLSSELLIASSKTDVKPRQKRAREQNDFDTVITQLKDDKIKEIEDKLDNYIKVDGEIKDEIGEIGELNLEQEQKLIEDIKVILAVWRTKCELQVTNTSTTDNSHSKSPR